MTAGALAPTAIFHAWVNHLHRVHDSDELHETLVLVDQFY